MTTPYTVGVDGPDVIEMPPGTEVIPAGETRRLAVGELDLASATLDELAVAAASHARKAAAHIGDAVRHCLRLGEVLESARGQLAADVGWYEWLDGVGINNQFAQRCIRLARYKDHLPPEAFEPHKAPGGWEPASLQRALRYLQGLPATHRKPAKYGPEVRAEALRLSAEGVPRSEVAELLGVSEGAIARWRDPKAASRAVQRSMAKRRAAEKALAKQREREERDRLAKTTGGELEVAYTHIRRALAAVSRAGAEATERALLKAEEAVIEAMRSAR